jgi:hypothetical protein
MVHLSVLKDESYRISNVIIKPIYDGKHEIFQSLHNSRLPQELNVLCQTRYTIVRMIRTRNQYVFQ